MMCIEKFKNLANEDVNILIEFVGESRCRNFIIGYGKNQPEYSEYYIGRKKNGKYWKGFRIEKLPVKKIQKFYYDQFKNENKDVLENFEKLILKTLNVSDDCNDSLKYKIMDCEKLEVIPLLLSLFDISMDIPYQKHEEEIKKVERKYLNLLKERETKFNLEVEDLLSKYNKKINSYNIEIQRLENENKKLEGKLQEIRCLNATSNDFGNLKEKLRINNKDNEQLIKACLSIIDDYNIKSQKKNNLIFDKLFTEIKSKFLVGEDISELIIVEYILYKWMEE